MNILGGGWGDPWAGLFTSAGVGGSGIDGEFGVPEEWSCELLSVNWTVSVDETVTCFSGDASDALSESTEEGATAL